MGLRGYLTLLETGAASCRAAAAELFGCKNLENSTLAGPCFRVPKLAENRLRSKVPPELKIPGCVKAVVLTRERIF